MKRISEHYDATSSKRRTLRSGSPILQLKNLNNWIKSVLISRYVRKGDRVLDLACGRGGDLAKFSHANVSQWVGVDISPKSVDAARSRYESRSMRFAADFKVLDFCSEFPGGTFDVASCQFALHYAFSSESRALDFFRNVKSALVPGGYFIATVPDEQALRRASKQNPLYSIDFKGGTFEPYAPYDF